MPMPIYVEAKNAGFKLCPLTIAAGSLPCVGPDCMAWRFGRTHIKDQDGNLTVVSDDTHGYCGLAGVPGQIRS